MKLGNRVLFPGIQPGRSPAVWSTDGTAAGTRAIHEVCSGSCDRTVVGFEPVAGRVLFVVGPADVFSSGDYVLWQTDGTAQGTRRLASFETNPFAFGAQIEPVAAGGRILFPAEVEGSGSRQLWATDGTPEGTGPISLIGRNGFGSNPTGFVSDGRGVWFAASSSAWRSEGTAATTVEVGGPEPVIVRGLALYVRWDGVESEGLWRSDGSPGGDLLLTPPGSGRFLALSAFGERAAFVLQRPDGAVFLGESDGTPAGTRTRFELPPHFGDELTRMVALGPELFFLGRNRNTSEPYFWRSDGTPSGTFEIDLGEVRFLGPDPVRVGNRIFFLGYSSRAQIWKLENPAGPPEPLLPVELPGYAGSDPSNLIEYQGALYFMAGSGIASGGRGLWRSDGTTAGVVLLASFNGSSQPQIVGFTPFGGRLYFASDDGEHGVELWQTDGTAAGTVLVRDIRPGPTSSSPQALAAAGGRLFFSANDGVHGFELWESDGTAAGTRMVQDIAPGVASSDPRELTASGGKLFFSADDHEHGREPWVLDLAGSGCQPSEEALCLGGRFRVEATWRDFEGHSGRGRAVSLTADTAYFWFFDPANVEVVLKALDGRTTNGHHWIFYGALSSVEYTLTVTDTETGATRRYVNLPGRLSSVADTRAFGPLGATGSDLTSAPATADPDTIVRTSRATAASCSPSATRLCLQGGRFAVEARWKDFQGKTGTGQAVPLSGDTGYFWFFGPDNVEVVLKVLDGRPLNNKFWAFYGALSSVEYTLTVTDTETGKVKTYTNPSGRLASVADTAAF